MLFKNFVGSCINSNPVGALKSLNGEGMDVLPAFTGLSILSNMLKFWVGLNINGAIDFVKNLSKVPPDIGLPFCVLFWLVFDGGVAEEGGIYPFPTVTTEPLDPGVKEELGHPVVFDVPPLFVIVPYVECVIETVPPSPPLPQEVLFPPTAIIIEDIGAPIEFVVDIDPAKNTVVLGDNTDIFNKVLIAKDVNLISIDEIKEKLDKKIIRKVGVIYGWFKKKVWRKFWKLLT